MSETQGISDRSMSRAGDATADMPQLVLTIAGLTACRSHGGARFCLSMGRLDLASLQPAALVGPSGSGKSTLLDVLGLVMTPTRLAAFMFFPSSEQPVDLAKLIEKRHEAGLTDMRRRYLGYMPQTGGLLPFLSVGENIRMSARLNDRLDEAYLDQLAQLLDLPAALMRRFPKDLSIGQRQRVSLARAMAHRPRLLLADEPTASLDAVTAGAVTGLLLDLSPRFGITPVIATHDERLFGRDGVRRLHVEARAGAEPNTVDAKVQI
ncbi:ATP-binding cassette domain-containing protein [Dongia soli]|uniref:ABC transporter ATP-binding protein n=1 Tax=Dongia soli TaxID=600628 RepID=A0ABU5EC82_9PROT|nr:ABC transporter ATP-binding protein [Dongia soli]MDY0883781.1 ABC transporter ATP-binding protein [Dongia soli]